MDHSASLAAPARRTRGIVIALVGLAVLGAALVVIIPIGSALKMLTMPLHNPTWFGWFLTVNGAALITVLALPFAALVVCALARRRSSRGDPSAWRMSLAEVGIVYGTVPWVWMIMLAGGLASTVNLVPLRDLLTMSASQIAGNLLVFAALGFFAPLRFTALASTPRILALAAACSILIETAQFVLPMDRMSSVDDVLPNAAGAGLAALASRHWWRTPNPADSGRALAGRTK